MTLMWKEICDQPAVLDRCMRDNAAVSELASRLAACDIRFVVIAARGTSDHAAIYGKYIIEHRIDLPVSLAAPSIVTAYESFINYRNCLVIAISQSGQAEDALAVIRQANSCGAVTVGITNNPDSPIAQESQYHLFTAAGEEKSVAATKTFTAQLMMLAHLVSVWKKDKKMHADLSGVPEKLSAVLALSEKIHKTAQDWKDISSCFVLARGMNYPIALEAALKIQETCYIEAKGFAISDFYHGPIAMIDNDDPVVLFAPEGPVLKDSADMFQRLSDLGAKIMLVTNDDGLRGRNRLSFPIPSAGNDMISVFYNAVFAQMLACSLSLAKGLDPDKPRSLRKVTITK